MDIHGEPALANAKTKRRYGARRNGRRVFRARPVCWGLENCLTVENDALFGRSIDGIEGFALETRIRSC